MFAELITKLMAGNSESQTSFNAGLAEFKTNLLAQDAIRFYVDNTANFGHQATTVHLIKRFVDLFTYKKAIHVFYAGGAETLNKLALLFTSLNPKQEGLISITYNGATINFYAYSVSVAPPDELTFGFTGGADDTAVNYADKLNVKHFLRLQPYNWRLEGGSGAFVPNRIEIKGKVETISLTGISGVFGAMPYTYDPEKVQNVPEEVWTWYGTTQTFDPILKARVNNCKALVDACNKKGEAEIWPAYGLHHQFGSGNSKGLGTLLNIILAGSIYQKNIQRFPIVLTLLNKAEDLNYKYINALFTSGPAGLKAVFKEEVAAEAQPQINSKQKLLDDWATKKPTKFVPQKTITANIALLSGEIAQLEAGVVSKKNDIDTLFKNLEPDIEGIDYSKVLKIIDRTNVTPGEISKVIAALGSNQIAVIVVGPQPQEVFNYLYGGAGLPCIFEGQGTSSLVISMGKPYFQLNKTGNPSINYPQVPVVESPHATLNTDLQDKISNPLRNFWSSVRGIQVKAYPTDIHRIAYYISSCYSASEPASKYFSLLKRTFQQPFYDKLRLGVVALNALTKPTLARKKLKKKRMDEISTLEQVYDALLANWADGQVDLFSALPDTKFKAYYSNIVSGSFNITVEKDDIIKSDDKVVIQSATTSSLKTIVDVLFAIEIEFTLDDDGTIVSDLKCTAEETWQVTNIPWMPFSDPGFSMRVYESSLPVQGGAIGTLASAGIQLEFGYPIENNTWVLTGTFEKDYPSISKFFQMAGGINLVQSLPAPLNSIAGFGLKKVQLVFDAENQEAEYILFEMGSAQPWIIIDNPRFEIQPFVNAVITNPASLKDRSVSFTIGGQMEIGGGTVNVTAQYPNFQVSTELIEGEIDLGKLSEKFGLPALFQSSVTSFNMSVLPSEEYYQLNAAIENVFDLTILGIEFSMTQLQFQVTSSSGDLSVNLAGKIVILPGDENLVLDIVLAYDKDIDWTFSAALTSGEVPIGKILEKYLGWSTKQNYGISDLNLSFALKPKSFEFSGKTAQPWVIDFLNLTIAANVKIGYITPETESELLKNELSDLPVSLLALEETSGAYGEISADIQWLGIDVNVFYNFSPEFKTYGIQWGNLIGEVKDETIEGVPCKVAKLHFKESTTIGSMVETMVGWATGSKFSLGAPWNILDSITLNNLEFTFNFTEKQAGLNVNLDPIEIGLLGINIAKITGFNISYKSEQEDPKENGVQVQLLGKFYWQEDPDKPLGWDASKPETTPGPPAQGNKYIDLKLLAMGQHVEVAGLDKATNVEQAIKIMKDLPDPDPTKVPPLTVNSNNGWLVGLDMGLLRIDKPSSDSVHNPHLLPAVGGDGGSYVFNVQVVFSDPDLYGLRISLDGDAAKVFKGLIFEIMYRQISQSVGVYQSEITLPDAMRYIRMGQLNITLPVFGIQVYTNGDFQVDLGFPWNGDFGRSFTLQTIIYVPVPIPVMGSIGLYFAKLSSATTTKVPSTTKGIFNPVVAFGLGFQIGLGYDFSIGVLSAGFQLTAFAIIEGVIAKWNPYLPAGGGENDRIEEDYYYAITGTLGLIGKLYGSVDFAIVKASVYIEINVMAQFYFAPYEPIEISLVAHVTASVSIKIIFFTINLSFSLTVEHHLTLPSASTGVAPWYDGTEKISLAKSRRLERTVRGPRLLQLRLAKTIAPKWDNLLPAETPADLQSYILFAITVARDENEAVPTLANQLTCGVSMLMMESVKAPQEDFTSSRKKALYSAPDSAFEKLAKQIFRWMAAAMQDEAKTEAEVNQLVVRREDLEAFLAYLNDKDKFIPIPEEAINTFMAQQFKVKVSEAQNTVDATYFPIAPTIGFSIEGTNYTKLAYTYEEYNSSSSDYLKALRAYFSELEVKKSKDETKDYLKFSLSDSKNPSVGSFIFTDYFALIAKQMLQMAINSLKNYKYPILAGQKNSDIVKWVNDAGNFNDYTLEKLFEDNKEHKLTTGKPITISGVTYVVQTGNTFEAIAATVYPGAFTAQNLAKMNAGTTNILNAGLIITYPERPSYTTLPGQSLDNIAKEVGVITDELISNSNIKGLANLLIAPSQLALPDFNYNTKDGDTLNSICSAIGTKLEYIAAGEANGAIVDLFATTDSSELNITQLSQFRVSELIQEIQYTQGLQHLAGLTSRYYMTGLRLPTKGLTPNYPGMWVTGNAEAYALPETAGLFALTGQQVPVSKLAGVENLVLTFTNNLCPWIVFGQDSTFSITITKDSIQNKQIATLLEFATRNYLDVGLTELGRQELFTIGASTYTFNSAISWVSPSAVNMAYTQSEGGPQSLRAWKIPDSLLNLPDLSAHAINPFMGIQLGTSDEATQTMQQAPFNNYAWGTRIDFSIKKISPMPGSPTSETTYELVGADGSNTLLLERMVAQLGNNESLISSFHIAYEQRSDNAVGAGIQTDNSAQLTIGLAQVNLTTVTQPPLGANEINLLAEQQNLTSSTEFIRLLWEASITQQGGYYLYYYNAESKTGLPDRIFDNNGNAKISLMVLFSNEKKDQVCNYMNVLVTASPVDFSAHTLYAETLSQPWAVSAADRSLNEITTAYFADIDDIVEKNKTLPLRNGAVIAVRNGLYNVGAKAPGANLNDIATYFGTTTDAIKAANKQITNWANPLPLYTSLFLPDLALNIGTSKGGNTLKDIAQYYSTTPSSIGIANADVKGIFNTDIVLSTGPFANTAAVTQDEMAIEALRPVPPSIPDNPEADQYAQIYLKNTFSLLGYKVYENPFFNESNMAIPLSPVAKQVSSTGFGKFMAPPMLQEGDEWTYKDSLPYTTLVKKLMVGSDNLPDPENSPYKGIGKLLQIDYNWQDLYGNSLLTTLNDSSSVTNLNKLPILIQYTDSLVGPSKWPSVNSNWQVLKVDTKPTLNLAFNFDSKAYDGLLKATVNSDEKNTITATFTNVLDAVSATNPSNYSFDAAITISKISLGADTRSVKIVVDKIPSGIDISLKVKGILNAGKTQTYSGTAGFSTNPGTIPTSTLITKATGDKSLYEKIWYQLTDGMGIELKVDTSVVPASNFILDAGQTNQLVQTWLGSIYLFVANRADAMNAVAAPNSQQIISFTIDEAKVETKDIFQLKFNFSIRRKKSGLLAGSAANIFESVSAIAPLSNLGDSPKDSYTQFVSDFESAFSTFFELRVASGVDRFASQVSGVSPLWAVRLNANPAINVPAIGYKINADMAPKLFAPRPISNQLISRTDVPIYPFKTDTGIDYAHPVYRNFIDIDVNLWCNQVFENFDDLLSPQYTAAIQLVDYKNNAEVSYFDKLTDQKGKLADIIKKLMVPVFKDELGIDTDTIRESFKQALLVRLSNAYNVKSGLQFSANVFNNNLDEAAYLFGNVNQAAAKTVQNIQFTSPKLSLATNKDAAFNFLLSAPQIIKGEKGEVLSSLDLDLSYAVTSIEHQIGELPGIKDYKASTWLKFFSNGSSVLTAQPLYNSSIEVPLPLNIFPTTPGMTGQSGKLSGEIDYLTLSDLLNWDYQLAYSQAFHYPQDTLHFSIQFNIVKDHAKLNAGLEDAFAEIAEMIIVLPAMKDAFDNLAKINTESGSQEIKDANITLSAYTTLVDNIIQNCGPEGLQIRKSNEHAFINPDGPYYFSIQEGTATIGTTEGVLLVSIKISNSDETALGGVPQVSIGRYATFLYNKDCKDGYCYYNYYFTDGDPTTNFLMAVTGQVISKRTITLSKLNVLARQDVSASVVMDRNSELVTGRPTNTQFVYTTGKVEFPNYYYPNFARTEPINMACIPTGKPVPATLETQLNNLFNSLLQKNKQSILSFKVVVVYDYPINAMDIRMQLPVMMMPIDTFTLSDPHKAPEGMITAWTGVIKTWLEQNAPTIENAKLVFDLSVFSNLTEEPKPLIQLSDVYVDTKDIVN